MQNDEKKWRREKVYEIDPGSGSVRQNVSAKNAVMKALKDSPSEPKTGAPKIQIIVCILQGVFVVF